MEKVIPIAQAIIVTALIAYGHMQKLSAAKCQAKSQDQDRSQATMPAKEGQGERTDGGPGTDSQGDGIPH